MKIREGAMVGAMVGARVCLILFAQSAWAIKGDVSNYGMTLPTAEQLQCFAHKAPLSFKSPRANTPEISFVLSAMAALAYSDIKVSEPIVRLFNFKKIRGLHERKVELQPRAFNWMLADTNVLWAESDSDIVIAFGGTDPNNKLHKLTDAQFIPVDFDAGKVHNGFVNGIEVVWEKLWVMIQAADPHKRLWFTGHSLGGALATLATLRVLGDKYLFPNFAGLYTFGSPLVGNDDFANEFTKRRIARTPLPESKRFVHSNDSIARMPESLYTHVGDEVYFDTGGALYSDQEARDRILPLYKLAATNLIIDHDIRFYMEYSYRKWTGAADSGCL